VLTREQLFAEVWGDDAGPRGSKVVDVLVCRLRDRLRAAGAGPLLDTIRSRGYRLRPPGAGSDTP
jgi:DNA-binding response OmpR family regulator